MRLWLITTLLYQISQGTYVFLGKYLGDRNAHNQGDGKDKAKESHDAPESDIFKTLKLNTINQRHNFSHPLLSI